MSADWKNKLYFGDNLPILREHIPDGSVDLIYLDPPFNSKATYNVLFSEQNGTDSAARDHASPGGGGPEQHPRRRGDGAGLRNMA